MMNKRQFEKELVNLFAKRTGCNIQYGGCPCNTCFHNIKNVDFRHLCWILVLSLRGDYKDYENAIRLIKDELNKTKDKKQNE